jgi:hypothetical protein
MEHVVRVAVEGLQHAHEGRRAVVEERRPSRRPCRLPEEVERSRPRAETRARRARGGPGIAASRARQHRPQGHALRIGAPVEEQPPLDHQSPRHLPNAQVLERIQHPEDMLRDQKRIGGRLHDEIPGERAALDGPGAEEPRLEAMRRPEPLEQRQRGRNLGDRGRVHRAIGCHGGEHRPVLGAREHALIAADQPPRQLLIRRGRPRAAREHQTRRDQPRHRPAHRRGN